MFDPDTLITDRLRAMDASGIRRVFDLAAQLDDPVNLSIGQPDFDVPQPIKAAAIRAIEAGQNKYTQTQGIAALRQRIVETLASEFPETLGGPRESSNGGEHAEANSSTLPDDTGLVVTSGVSGGLMLALLTCAGPGDEVVIPDPYFVMYRHLVTLAGATPVYVDTYPDFQVTAERLEPHLTERTKLVLFNSPSNPTGVTADRQTCRDIVRLCEDRGVLLVSDEIYNEFCYDKPGDDGSTGAWHLPSPLAYSRNVMLLRGFSKTYAMTGWRLGYALGPQAVIEQMTKLQQYSFVCAPSMTQAAGVAGLDLDMSGFVEAYRGKRDLVVERLSPHFELATPAGAFYAFPRVPRTAAESATKFVERAIEQNLLIIPGNVFSGRDTHFRLSYACDDQTLDRGLDILVHLAS